MLRTALTAVLATAVASSCTVHLHIHEAESEPAPMKFESEAARTAAELPSNRIAGVVRGADGDPIDAHVTLVIGNGSYGVRTSGGEFEFRDLRGDVFVLRATTEDGRYGVLPHVTAGTDDVVVTPDRAGAYVDITMTGRPTARFAVFQDGLRVADNTVRDGKTARFLVPTGGARCVLYGQDLERELSLDLTGGQVESVRYALVE